MKHFKRVWAIKYVFGATWGLLLDGYGDPHVFLTRKDAATYIRNECMTSEWSPILLRLVVER